MKSLMCARTAISMYVYVHTCVHTLRNAHTHVCISMYTYTYMYTTCVRTSCFYAYLFGDYHFSRLERCIHACIHTYMHAYIHTYIMPTFLVTTTSPDLVVYVTCIHACISVLIWVRVTWLPLRASAEELSHLHVYM